MRSTLQSLRARREQSDKGFTLIELLVVVVIIGVLIAIAIPLYLNYQKSSHDKAAESDVRNAAVVIEQCYSDTGTWAYTWTAGTANADGSNTMTDATDCPNGTINVSPGTTLEFDDSAADAGHGVLITGYNANGHHTTNADAYVIDTAEGGSVHLNS